MSQFLLDFDTHHQKEEGHQPIVDPKQDAVFEMDLRRFEADLVGKQ